MKVKNYPLSIEVYGNAYIRATQVNSEKKQFKAGVYNRFGGLIREGLRQDIDYLKPEHFTQIDKEHITLPCSKSISNLSGHYIYLGFYTEHHGHFLLETLSRLWAIKNSEQFDGFIFNDFIIPRKSDEFSNFALFCFNKLGIDTDKIIVLEHDVVIEKLTIPNAQCYILNKAHPNYIDIFKRLRHGVLDIKANNLKLYLSRSKLQKRKRKIVNEHKIEEVFTEHGFKVIYMEDLAIDMQLFFLQNAKAIAGLEGSALHNCLFMKPGGKVINICSVRQPEHVKPNQIMCNQLNSMHSLFIPFTGQVIDEVKQTARFDIPALRRALKNLNFNDLLKT